MVYTYSPSRTFIQSFRSSSRDNIKTHSRTFSIAHRVRRKRQRLPSNGVIESAFNISAQLKFVASALPMNASR
jgi:hypothetical protein